MFIYGRFEYFLDITFRDDRFLNLGKLLVQGDAVGREKAPAENAGALVPG